MKILPSYQLRRFVLVGCSGSGKSTLALQLGAITDLPVLELDHFFHRENWTQPSLGEFRRAVFDRIAVANETHRGWIVDGSYDQKVGQSLQARADTIVWVDTPRWKTLFRVAKRSLWRVVTQAELWNGNRESWRNLLSLQPSRNVVLWAWIHHPRLSARCAERLESDAWAHAQVFRIRNEEDARSLLSLVRDRPALA